MTEYMGKDGFVWWQGVVEDRHDPLFLGRCRVRILGWHTEDKTDMPTESLPWAYPVQPILSAAQTGVGISPTGPVEGTWVVGFYRDGMQGQEPVFFGTLGGIPEVPSVPNVGFNDPRGDFIELPHIDLKRVKKDYPKNPLEFKGDALEDNVPYPPKNLSLFKRGKQPDFETSGPNNTSEKNTKRFLTQTSGIQSTAAMFLAIEEHGTRSTYPRSDDTHVLGQPTTPKAAIGKSQTDFDYSQGIVAQKIAQWGVYTGDGFSTASLQTAGPEVGTGFKWKDPIPQSIYGAKYPYNHVHQSESGHLIEVDDTPGKERLHRYHRTGTFEEIGALGQKIIKVVNENFHIGLNNDYTAIFGNKYENISGRLDIVAANGFDLLTTKNINMKGKSFGFEIDSANISVDPLKGITLDAGTGVIELIGRRVKKTITEASDTDTIRGSLRHQIGGLYSLETGSTSITSRGSTGITSGGAMDLVVTGALHETITNFSLPPAAEARKTTATFGDINFNTANFGIGNFNVDLGPMLPGQPGGTGLLSSFQMTPTGNISLKSLISVSTFEMGAAGIDLKYLGGLASISVGATGIELSYGASSIKLGIAGITLEGVLINSTASGINTVEGSLVKLN